MSCSMLRRCTRTCSPPSGADFAIQNENRLRRQLQATQDRFEVGEVTRTDVAQADARLSGAIADRVRAEGELTAARATIGA